MGFYRTKTIRLPRQRGREGWEDHKLFLRSGPRNGEEIVTSSSSGSYTRLPLVLPSPFLEGVPPWVCHSSPLRRFVTYDGNLSSPFGRPSYPSKCHPNLNTT